MASYLGPCFSASNIFLMFGRSLFLKFIVSQGCQKWNNENIWAVWGIEPTTRQNIICCEAATWQVVERAQISSSLWYLSQSLPKNTLSPRLTTHCHRRLDSSFWLSRHEAGQNKWLSLWALAGLALAQYMTYIFEFCATAATSIFQQQNFETQNSKIRKLLLGQF